MGSQIYYISYNRDYLMKNMLRFAALAAVLTSLTACTGHIENKNKTCSYDYLLHPAISISKMIGGCGPAADQK